VTYELAATVAIAFPLVIMVIYVERFRPEPSRDGEGNFKIETLMPWAWYNFLRLGILTGLTGLVLLARTFANDSGLASEGTIKYLEWFFMGFEYLLYAAVGLYVFVAVVKILYWIFTRKDRANQKNSYESFI
jgi:hypothetical protein